MTMLCGVALTACGGNGAQHAAAEISAEDAKARLVRIVLTPDDVGGGFTQDVARVQTNQQAADARPDTENALRQFGDWGQVLAYNVQYGATADAELVYTGKIARVMNTATLFRTSDGASAALAFERGLSSTVIANVLVNESAGTKISDTQVMKDIAFPAKGDESFAWRLSGKATFEDGFVSAFVADAVFVREGNVTGSVIAVGLGDRPDAKQFEALIDRFVERARAPQ